jgi:hypothetical protein
VLVPDGKSWLHRDEPIDEPVHRVLTGWAGALAVGYVRPTDGTPAGEEQQGATT